MNDILKSNANMYETAKSANKDLMSSYEHSLQSSFDSTVDPHKYERPNTQKMSTGSRKSNPKNFNRPSNVIHEATELEENRVSVMIS
jgi:hypothetical protein